MSTAARIVIVDYGTSNLAAVHRRLLQAGANAIVSSEAQAIRKADKILLPGIGHFRQAMRKLDALGLSDALHEAVLVHKTPILGICLGMQLLAERSAEGGDIAGLGWIKGSVQALPVKTGSRYKIPHMGWNTATTERSDCPLMEGLDNASFYFTHSYHFVAEAGTVLQTTEWSIPFASAVAHDNIFGVQYHPEKSYEAGLQLLKNFASL